jgi:aspartyl/asparaginyl beta-hydroxylase (cupin superfamily)
VAVWWGLALACKGLGEEAAQRAAADKVLAIDAADVPALMMKGDHFARAGDGRAAHAFYLAASKARDVRPELAAEVRRAQRECERYTRSYETHLMATLTAAGWDPDRRGGPFAHALDLLFGRREIYFQAPTAFFYPELPQRQFYEREEFPWLAALEARTEAIRDEFLAVAQEEGAFRPYVESNPSRPRREYGRLLDNPDWSAFYLIREGRTVEAAAARCPATMAALAEVPLTDAPGQTPAVLFSRLRPKTRIPPHTGYTNARLICHLPLVVPEGCGLRVGNETRTWTPGRALVFDDSIEHEAWNNSDEPRAVLLFDIWRPELSAEERRLVAAVIAAVGAYSGGAWT